MPIPLEYVPYFLRHACRISVATQPDHAYAIRAAGQPEGLVAGLVVDLINKADMHQGLGALDSGWGFVTTRQGK